MALTEKINVDLKEAMKAKDKVKLESLRAIKAALLMAATEKGASESSEELELKMLQKLVKQRKDAATIYTEQGRDDLAQPELDQVAIIEKYLPEKMGDDEVKAILCARGGYGCVQIVDKIQWANMLRNPKWIIGFSDVSVFHQKLWGMGLKSIHGTMPLNFSDNSVESLSTLKSALTTNSYSIKSKQTKHDKAGSAKAILIGGNLSILYSLLGTDDHVDYNNSILFIEDLSEPIYHLDRMLYALSKAGVLSRIKGLVVGGMTDMTDTAVPFGMVYEEVILSHFEYRNIPLCFNFPAGHINDNRAIIIGSEAELNVSSTGSELRFL